MSDGAQLGYGAEASMKAAIGGEQPTERASAGDMGARIMALTEETYEHTYDGTADWTANRIITWLQQDPTRAQSPTENVYEQGIDGRLVFNAEGGLNLVECGWYGRMKDDGFDLSELGVTIPPLYGADLNSRSPWQGEPADDLPPSEDDDPPLTADELAFENAQLREALREQWLDAHWDHCGCDGLPKPQGCQWRPPVVLRPYVDGYQ